MKNKFIILLILLLFHGKALAEIKIVASINPIASIVSMLVGDAAKVTAIDIADGCPHHYHAKPSDLEQVANATMVIYIDENFDGFISKMLENSHAIKLRISDLEALDFQGADDKVNWHFWLDLDNVMKFSQLLAEELAVFFPELKPVISKNLFKSMEQLAELKVAKDKVIKETKKIVLFNDSLEHFFQGYSNVSRMYHNSNVSLKYIWQIHSKLNDDPSQCIVLDLTQDTALYQKFTNPIVQLDSENWHVDTTLGIEKSQHFYYKYREMINELKKCTIH
ncbi:MAG: zinc ABC transporter substrate-binding protein [Rickettsiaceae bacterium]|nr:zinc ABC transporter substrate-binding protein [Rickettsiaceae bacterium]